MRSNGILGAALLACVAGVPAHAQDPLQSVSSTNAAFEQGQASGLSPQTASEYLLCHALWQRWELVLAGMASPGFSNGLHSALDDPQEAAKAARYWLKRARTEASGEDIATAQEMADRDYAAYIQNDPNRETALPWNLGTCTPGQGSK